MSNFIASCSFGKDSIATILLALENEEPLHEVIYCEVMFDTNISGEVPEHRDFIYNKAIPFFKSKGLKINVLREPEKTYVSEFTRKIKKGKHAGQIKSFPLCGHCNISRDLKFPIINRYKRNLPKNTKQYIGIAADEQNRLLRLDGDKISLLDKYHFTEHMAKQKCLEYGLLSPLYEFSERGGVLVLPKRKAKRTTTLIRLSQGFMEKDDRASKTTK